MAALTIQKAVDAGTVPSFVLNTVTLSDTAQVGNGHNTVLWYKNTDTNIKTLTIPSQFIMDNGSLGPNTVFTLAASTGQVVIPLRKSYDDGVNGATVNLTGTGGVTGVTVAAIQVL